MKTIIPAIGALTVALAMPHIADAQDRGNGNGRGGGHERGHQDRGGGNDDRGRGRGGEARAERGPSQAGRPDRGPRGDDGHDRGRGQARELARGPDPDRGRGRGEARRVDRDDDDRPAAVVRAARPDDRPDAVFFRDDVPGRGLIAGCPPGLARKNNGCLPPGRARQIARAQARYDYLWRGMGDGGQGLRYDNGYLYRYNDNGALMGWLPALGGALGMGNVWPARYPYQPAPDYYANYYRLPGQYDYRYADGVLYGVDPRTQAIGQVAALLTGQPWTVGQPMPTGYDVYNVPYAWRSQYYDRPDALYRYSDGYVYQVDPTTRLVQAVIQLLA